ncbi:MAG TPA: D-alanyl-D-alanine carboxypeptidase [Candidatus Bariatricus faecipullorum]|nr:D-alanyl-D-alanine carboxypeptidase [Candidatus Bariatricus faecipullorum]
MKRILAVLLCICLYIQPLTVRAEEETGEEGGLELSARTALIMEASTGNVLYEKDADTPLPPASVTKVMTLLLIFEALEAGELTLEEEVTTSEYAASMGGSQVFLEAGEAQTVDTLIKCIAVASANDACVTMAERISGSEDAFVQAMNEKAKQLGMAQTHFVNCNGLDAEGHVTSARDIALMSRELITRFPQIRDYTTIWMDTITHATSRGTSEFGLSNTNRLLRQYEYATGLKTGSTSEAGFCLAATAEKEGIEMIAVVMAEPDAKTRVKDAIAMLNYGFSQCSIYRDDQVLEEPVEAEVEGGVEETVSLEAPESFSFVDTAQSDLGLVEKEVRLETGKAPVEKGAVLGEVVYTLNGAELGRVSLTADASVEPLDFPAALLQVLEQFFLPQ